MQSTTERIARRLGLWSWFGRVRLMYYGWAKSEISPMHPDAPAVGQYYDYLRRQFGTKG